MHSGHVQQVMHTNTHTHTPAESLAAIHHTTDACALNRLYLTMAPDLSCKLGTPAVVHA